MRINNEQGSDQVGPGGNKNGFYSKCMGGSIWRASVTE